MIWMSWRQFRSQAVAGVVAIAALAAYLLVLGVQIRHGYADSLALCRARGGDCTPVLTDFQNRFSSRLYLTDAALLLIPALTGLFWGAPLVARELESGTHRLVWNQSITRRRWLTVKLTVGALAAMVLAGAASLLLTWAASPFDQVAGNRFTTLLFGARNIVPMAYAVFALVLGTVTGIVVRRTVPAMALTFVVFAAVQILVPNVLRPHLLPPVAATERMTAEAVRNLSFLGADATISGLRKPGAWVTSTSGLLAADGRPVERAAYEKCTSGSFDAAPDCLARLDLHVRITYQPDNRYWPFQWLESLLFLIVGVLLAGVGLWRIRSSDRRE